MEEVSKDIQVVIIDDDFAVRQIFGLLLKHFSEKQSISLEVYSSSNGLEGMGYLMVTLPDIIILDTTLPKYSGTEIAQFLVSNPRYKDKDLKVLLVEGSDYLSEGFLKFNKKEKGFVKLFLEETLGKEVLESPSRTDRLILSLASKNIRIIDFADRQIKAKDIVKSPFGRLLRSFAWIIAQLFSSVLLVLLYGFLGRWDDENVNQSKEDLTKYRVRYYPTVATLIISFFVLVLQFSLFTAGGIAIINSRVVDAVADDAMIVEIEMEEAEFKNNEIKYDGTQYSFEGSEEKKSSTITFTEGFSYSKIIRVYEQSSLNTELSSTSSISFGYTLDNIPETSITYQISSDGELWYFYNGNTWALTGEDADESNTVQELNMYISQFENSSKELYVRVFLHSVPQQEISLEKISFEVEYNFIQKLTNE